VADEPEQAAPVASAMLLEHQPRGPPVPASRSRTEHWRDSLRKVYERGGALEICIDRTSDADDRGADLVWRVKIIGMTDGTIVVEAPAACGASIPIQPGVRLIGAMVVGQNRWMFHTDALGLTAGQILGTRAIVLRMPDTVERCTRRGFYRISTADLRLPSVQCWPLIDPASVGAAEAANRAQIEGLLSGESDGLSAADIAAPPPIDSLLLPEVGPMFAARLLNISGGGLGLLLAPEDARAIEARPFLWLRVDLRPEVPAPVAVTARLAHTHIDSSQCLYAGLAFDFAHNPAHRKFVVDLFTGYTQALMARQPQIQSRAA
jgi:hypothetical protein